MRFKIFFGTCRDGDHADDHANKWLSEHPRIEIVETKYQQARMGDHSICIMYKEKE